MLNAEKRTAFSLATVVGLRLFGLFLIMPVLAAHARGLPEASARSVGLALGIYGLTQALLQIPLGALSDRIGRKPVIIGGLLVFAAGSVVAAIGDSMLAIISGRALQGMGAIAAAGMALAADLSRPSQRRKVMAIIGIAIGGAFAVSMLLGPALYGWFGMSGLFWLTAWLTVPAIALVALAVPSAPLPTSQGEGPAFADLLTDIPLWRLVISAGLLHLGLTALFVGVPLQLISATGWEVERHGWLYLPAMVVSVLALRPVFTARDEAGQRLLRWAAIVMGAGALVLTGPNLATALLGLALFFAGFNVIEALLPAALSRQVGAAGRGRAMGMFTTVEFLGAFLGGMLGGVVQGAWGFLQLAILIAVMAGLLALIAPPQGNRSGEAALP